MQGPDEEQRYREELEREYVRLKVELAQIQSDTERHKLLSEKLGGETDELRSAISQSQGAEREMRDLARQLTGEVSKLQQEVRAKEEERDRVKAEAERTQEQRAQLERTLEVLGGREVTELLNARRESAGGLAGGGAEPPRPSANGDAQAGRQDGGDGDSESNQSASEQGSAGVAGGLRSLGESVRISLSRTSLASTARHLGKSDDSVNDEQHPSAKGTAAHLFEGDADDPNDDKDDGSIKESLQSMHNSVSSGLHMSVKNFMRGLDEEC